MSVIIYPSTIAVGEDPSITAVSQGPEPPSHLPSCLFTGASTGPCQPPTSPSVPLNITVEGKVGYWKVPCCSSTQGVSSSEIYKVAPVDRHQCRAGMRHITS